MFCTKCGAKNPEEATFCYKCGNEMKVIKDKKMTEKPKSFHDNVQNKISLLKNKKWLYGIIAVAVLLLGFGGYKWYEKHFTFAGAVVNNVYKVKMKTRVGDENTSTFTTYSTFKRSGNQILELSSYKKDEIVDLRSGNVNPNKIKKDNYGHEYYDKSNISVVKYNKDMKKWKRITWKDVPKVTLTKNGYRWHIGNSNTEMYVSITATRVD